MKKLILLFILLLSVIFVNAQGYDLIKKGIRVGSGGTKTLIDSTELKALNGVTAPIPSLLGSKLDTSAVVDYFEYMYSKTQIDALNQNIKNSSKKLRALKAMGSTIKYLPIWDMQTGVGGAALTDGNVYTIKFYVDKADTITGVLAFMKTQGVFTGDNFNGAALFSVAGGVHTRIAISANDENFWKVAANLATAIPFTSTVVIQPGLYVVNILYNASSASTAPQIGSDNAWGTNIQNFFGLTNTNRLSDTKASMTTIPSSYNSSDAGYSGNTTLWSIALY